MKKISIIVPVFNGNKFLDQFFSFFAHNELNNQIEVIIVDNDSDTSFLNELEAKVSNYQNIHLYSFNEKKSSYAARNYGFSKAKGDLIAFTDFDCVITKQYIEELTKVDSNKPDLISGKVELFHVSTNIYELFDSYAYLKQEEYFDNSYAATANLVLPKSTFQKLVGFEELISGGDNEFCKRAIANGYKITFNESLLVKHPLRGTYKEHYKKTLRLGKGHGQLFKLKKKNLFQKFLFIIKNIVGVFIPFHQLSIFFKIVGKEKISIVDTIKLFRLCYIVGSFQRVEIIKRVL